MTEADRAFVFGAPGAVYRKTEGKWQKVVTVEPDESIEEVAFLLSNHSSYEWGYTNSEGLIVPAPEDLP